MATLASSSSSSEGSSFYTSAMPPGGVYHNPHQMQQYPLDHFPSGAHLGGPPLQQGIQQQPLPFPSDVSMLFGPDEPFGQYANNSSAGPSSSPDVEMFSVPATSVNQAVGGGGLHYGSGPQGLFFPSFDQSVAGPSSSQNDVIPMQVDVPLLQQQQMQAAALLNNHGQLLPACSQSSSSFLPFGGVPCQQPLGGQQRCGSAASGLPSSHATALDSCSHISHALMCYQQGGEDPEFVKKAIESLVKKLKDKRVELEALISAVTSAGKAPSACVTIQRSLDGRLQVAGRKGVPHVVYARIWRWPNVGKNELQKLPICGIAPDNQDYICINPYHYERVVSSAIDVGTSLRAEFGSAGATGFTGQRREPLMDEMGGGGDDVWPLNRSTTTALRNEMPTAVESYQPHSSLFGGGGDGMARFHKFDLNRVQIPPSQHYPEHWCTINYYELDTQIGESFKARRELMEVTVDGGLDPQGDRVGRLCIGALPNVHRSAASEKAIMHVGAGIVLRQHVDGRVTIEVRSHKPVFLRAPFLDYMKRTPYLASVHRLTGDDGQITIFDLRWAYAEMCDQTQSANEAVMAQARAVAGLPVLHPAVQQVSHEAFAGSGVDDMKRVFCSIGLSFLKGWGAGYPRQSIKNTPCWIEIQLHRPLQLLDQLLKRNYF